VTEAADEPDQSGAQLKRFLDGGDFDRNAPAHLILAVACLNRCASF
jgi:hypothetical protein